MPVQVCTPCSWVAPPRSRRPDLKGWQPADDNELPKLLNILDKIPEGASVNDTEDVSTQAVRRVAATASRSRSRDPNPPEPQGIELARRRLALASTPAEHRHWAKVLYRRKRAWARRVADFKIDKGALHMERSDKKLSAGTSFLLKPDGDKEHDVPNWPGLITKHFSNQSEETRRDCKTRWREHWSHLPALGI